MAEKVTMIIGVIAGSCTSLSLLPQLIKILKEKKANDISLFYLAVLFVGLVLWIIYGVRREDIPVIVTNGVAIAINVLIIIAGIRYKNGNT
ncbi:SemiSWEET transporter [Chryseolinea sp. T2]|uniref:SemiSWEET family sugar transporter n=1 Tax=Chryseolinea sp. T2 TaxID=3129255 RepID=UPI00307781F8